MRLTFVLIQDRHLASKLEGEHMSIDLDAFGPLEPQAPYEIESTDDCLDLYISLKC
jgi:hypothetical protein